MTSREKILAGVLVGVLLGGMALSMWLTEAQEASLRAEGQIERLRTSLEDLRASESVLRDSLEAVQSEAEEARDSAEAVIAETDTVLVVQLDTIQQLVQDTTALRLIAERDSVHEVRVTALEEVIEAQAEEINVLRSLDLSNQQIIANLEAQAEQYEIANDALEDAVRGLRLQRKVERGVGLGLVAFVAYRTLNGG